MQYKMDLSEFSFNKIKYEEITFYLNAYQHSQ